MIKRHTAIRETFEEIGVLVYKNGYYDEQNSQIVSKFEENKD